METIRLKKGLGQNLLTDKNQIRKIMESVNINKDDLILEVGPGMGAITFEIAKIAKKVICVEKDKEMVLALDSKIKEE
jgi:16S rRNA (adenine1518-N6/adenine1519-N6)-dimethyltransferase